MAITLPSRVCAVGLPMLGQEPKGTARIRGSGIGADDDADRVDGAGTAGTDGQRQWRGRRESHGVVLKDGSESVTIVVGENVAHSIVYVTSTRRKGMGGG
eukprot:CAMPEP_0175062390 /NCGR_PEP_ID=MMETSP0052_2-20121109/14142_1 /TAXON_ID=51329 ORGANISM="Polytomella parva, Strain SAG 63-3" /NCGR_SAMPLE_ID=MMETSP0052_2 /ASSEMBLY_ACC=CAM_ASM_000194 /LENGTH=99 /DNA_ID=CAMNT_0016328407 /DNA_START=293 /DNA_END=592 /DNA_ORIENTATION=+